MPTMDDDGREREPTPYDDMSPVRRFYNDVLILPSNPVDIMVTFEQLLASENLIDDMDDIEGLRTLIVHMFETTSHKRVLKEQYMLMPLRLMAPYLDTINAIEDLEAWYDDAVSHLVSFTKNHHGDRCLDDANGYETDSCVKSKDCPVVVAARFLSEPMTDPDFNSIDYMIDPARSRDIATMKLNVAAKRNLVGQETAQTRKATYDVRYAIRFTNLGQNTDAERQQ